MRVRHMVLLCKLKLLGLPYTSALSVLGLCLRLKQYSVLPGRRYGISLSIIATTLPKMGDFAERPS